MCGLVLGALALEPSVGIYGLVAFEFRSLGLKVEALACELEPVVGSGT